MRHERLLDDGPGEAIGEQAGRAAEDGVGRDRGQVQARVEGELRKEPERRHLRPGEPRSVLHTGSLPRFPGTHSPTSLCKCAVSRSYKVCYGITVLEGASCPGLVIP